jgi:hypothetical protein
LTVLKKASNLRRDLLAELILRGLMLLAGKQANRKSDLKLYGKDRRRL